MVTKEGLFARAVPLNVRREGRVLWLLLLLVFSFCAWASWAEIEEQIRVPGEVIVSSRSQIVQAVDGGVLAKLYVQEGQVVEKGELLAELDHTRFAANAAETAAKVLHLRATIQRFSAELEGRELQFSPDVAADPELVESQTNLHQRRLELQREERSAIQRSLALAQQELDALVSLASTGDAARAEVLRSRQRVVELRAEMVNKRNQHRREAQEKLTAARGELAQAVEVGNQRRAALEATYIHAPMAGAVKNVSVTTIGAVLKSGEEILQIVPSDDPLIVEARVSSADVAFVRPDLRANVKLDAYDSTIYGALTGKVTYISPDTIDEDLEQNEEPYYRVLINITDVPETLESESYEIIPGMTALVEIITGERTVAQYLLKPLLRGSAAALTER